MGLAGGRGVTRRCLAQCDVLGQCSVQCRWRSHLTAGSHCHSCLPRLIMCAPLLTLQPESESPEACSDRLSSLAAEALPAFRQPASAEQPQLQQPLQTATVETGRTGQPAAAPAAAIAAAAPATAAIAPSPDASWHCSGACSTFPDIEPSGSVLPPSLQPTGIGSQASQQTPPNGGQQAEQAQQAGQGVEPAPGEQPQAQPAGAQPPERALWARQADQVMEPAAGEQLQQRPEQAQERPEQPQPDDSAHNIPSPMVRHTSATATAGSVDSTSAAGSTEPVAAAGLAGSIAAAVPAMAAAAPAPLPDISWLFRAPTSACSEIQLSGSIVAPGWPLNGGGSQPSQLAAAERPAPGAAAGSFGAAPAPMPASASGAGSLACGGTCDAEEGSPTKRRRMIAPPPQLIPGRSMQAAPAVDSGSDRNAAATVAPTGPVLCSTGGQHTSQQQWAAATAQMALWKAKRRLL